MPQSNPIFSQFTGILLFIGALIPFLIMRRLLYVALLRLLYGFTRDLLTAHKIHFFLVFPGVLLHELSHYLAFRLMGVSCRLNLGVQIQDNSAVYGSVEFYENDVSALKHFISGITPLVTGLVAISLLSIHLLGLPSIQSMAADGAEVQLAALWQSAQTFWFWLALYLIFAISSEMVPSPSDRRYWIHLGLILVVLIIIAVLTQTTQWLLTNLYPYIDGLLRLVGVTFLIGLVPQFLVWLPIRIINWLRA
jgi:hypothetical protein